MSDLLPKFRGCLLGLIAGDALGAPLSGLSPQDVSSRHGRVDGPVSECARGTDESAQALLAAGSYADCGGFDPVDMSDRLLRYYMEEPEFISHLTREACENLLYGYQFERAGRQAWQDMPPDWRFDNACLARTVPTGLVHYHDHVHLVGESRVACGITHFDERCKLACVCLNMALSHLLLADAHGVIEELCEWIQPRNTVLGYAIAAAQHIGPGELRTTNDVVDTLQAGLWAAIHCENFEEGLLLLSNMGGSAEVTCAIGGALLGARFGSSSIPAGWLDHLQARADAESLAARLFDLSQQDTD